MSCCWVEVSYTKQACFSCVAPLDGISMKVMIQVKNLGVSFVIALALESYAWDMVQTQTYFSVVQFLRQVHIFIP